MDIKGSFAGLLTALALLCASCEPGYAVALAEAAAMRARVEELYRQGRFAEALPLAQQELQIREVLQGPEHKDTATALNHLAALLQVMGEYKRAEPLLQRALAIDETVSGPMHSDTATALNNLAENYKAMGTYRRAEPLLQRALAIDETVSGPMHPDTATALNNLAELYRLVGAFGRAELLYQRSLGICSATLGPKHPDTAGTLNNLAVLYQDLGMYDKAEHFYRRALEIREEVLGPTHSSTAQTLSNLAVLLKTIGEYSQAERLYHQALTSRSETLGPEHPDTVNTLHNLGGLYVAMGAYHEAERVYQSALAIREKVLGAEHALTAGTRSGLASTYQARGAYPQADLMFKRALASQEQGLGPEHPLVATLLNNLAGLYYITGDYTEAEPLFRRALAIRRKVLGPEHPEVAIVEANAGYLSWAKEDLATAAEHFSRSSQIWERNLQLALAIGSESRKQTYMNTLANNLNAIVAFALGAPNQTQEASSLGLQALLQRKGRVLEAMSQSYGALRERLDAEGQELFDTLRDVRRHWATLVLQGVGQLPLEEYRSRVEQLQKHAEELETQMSARSAEFRTQTESMTLARIQQAIPVDAALVEYVRYRPFDPKAKDPKQRWGEAHYAAFVLKRESSAQAVMLGEAASIDKRVAALRQTLRNPSSKNVTAYAKPLEAQLLDPLRPLLRDVKRVLLSPDGELNLLPFGVLMDQQGQYLIQRYELVYLTSGRDLMRLAQQAPARSEAVVLADPDYGSLDQTMGAAPEQPIQMLATARRSNNYRPEPYTRLEGTAQEAETLRQVLGLTPNQVLTRDQATEEAVKDLKGPRILHIATHGFFEPDQARPAPSAVGPLLSAQQASLPGENPLLRSGLALAGANWRKSGPEDGILTALEASGLDLWGTTLVVLSACETGVGQVQTGEGVYGLRRALVLAGAQSLVMSLWKVEDAATKDLMVAYYKNIKQRQGRAEALRQAQLDMLANAKRQHPFYWAAFMHSGAWQAMQ